MSEINTTSLIRGPTSELASVDLELFLNPKSEAIETGLAPTGIPELDMPIIGVFSGEYARLDSTSTNNRGYTSAFWKEVLDSPQVKKRLKDGLMIGTFEHPTARTFFKQDGDFSSKHHIYGAFVVKELKIKGKIVWGKSYILNTPMGRLLAMYLRARDPQGNPLFNVGISARGFSRKDYINSQGIDMMRSDDYYLETFDATLTPGIVTARPKLESEGMDESAKVHALIDEYVNTCKGELCNIQCEVTRLKKELGL